MSNPGGSVSINSLSIAVPAGIIMFIITAMLFHFKDIIPSFTMVLWISIPIIAFLITSGLNLVSQYMYCRKVDSGKAFLGAIPAFLATLIALGVASFSICRIPVASIVVPFFTPETPANSSKNAKCCNVLPTLESIEASAPMVSGLAYGFYLFFSMLFGIVIGSGTAVVC
jgi:chromate transport protein ChrA